MKQTTQKEFSAVVIGASAGGIKALSSLLAPLPREFSLPIIIVQHLHPHSESYLSHILSTKSELHIKQADEKESLCAGSVYIAPPNYHLLVEEDHTLSLSLDTWVNYSRPSIDVLFETAAYAYRDKLIGIVLTGANYDGSQGLKKIKDFGGYAIVQEPSSAEVDVMHNAAIEATTVDKVLPPNEIGIYLLQLVRHSKFHHD